MRPIPGTRPPVAKLIEESSVISDSDVLYSYIKEITRFYSSEYKTSSEILSQFKKDIEGIVNSYKLACGFSFEKEMRGLSESLQFLMWETANMGLHLDDNTLLELGLDKVLLNRPIEQMGKEWSELDRLTEEFGSEIGFKKFREKYPKGTIKPSKVLRSVYDCTLVYYKNHKFESCDGDFCYPEIPKELIWLFPNENQCIEFVKKNYGKDAPFIAYEYLGETGVINPSDTNNSIPVVRILFDYFIKPFNNSDSARKGFYRLFK